MASSLITSSVIRRRISIQRHQHRAHLPSQQTPPIELEISIKCSPEMAEHVEMDDIHKLTLLQARVSETNKENQHVMQPGNPSNDTSNKKQKQCFDKIEDKEGSQGARYECCGRELVVAVLDPTQKLTFVEFVFARFYGETRGRELTEMVKEATYELFSEYKRVNSLQVSKKKIGKSPSIEEFFSNTSIDDDFDNTSTEDDFGDDPDEMEDG
nr:zinc finger BED domain-containing protein RICESLEEPER 2-like [Ipomoea batatas]GMD70020.1 zinc finger BED domain-containing protein RICESLEEPER 2-like [Ipomoea batatas]